MEANSDDPFDRQRCIHGWNNELISSKSVLVLGAGGIGCAVITTLARLGVKRIFIVDQDFVETSNLNRQSLFSINDIGVSKAKAASEHVQFHNVGAAEIVHIHGNVLEIWSRVVGIARECSVLFNNVDIGHYFDYAALSLCKKLGIPYCSGSSYSSTWIVEYFSGDRETESFSGHRQTKETHIYEMLSEETICSLPNLLFLPSETRFETRSIGSSILVSSSAGTMAVNAWLQGIMGKSVPNYTKCDISAYWEPEGMVTWPSSG